MAKGGSVSIECGLCYQKDKDIQDPRVLPCSHIFCRGCLAGQLELLKVIRCTACSKTYDAVVDNLPTYKPDVPKHKCDVCTKKGKGDQPAVMYCNSCTKKYCERHQESDGDLHEDHVTMSIAEYINQADRLETRHCTKHKEQPYTLGCRVCLTVFCPSCVSAFNICTNGKAHKLLNLGNLVTTLTSDINKLREAMMCKEEKLFALFKKTSKNISEYEEETKEMIEKLHQTRDKQIDAIQTKYQKLEEELIKTRKETRAEMLLFMEEEVGNNLTNLANHRMRIEARVRNNHQVDIVNTYRDTQTEIAQLTGVQLPALPVDNVKTLSITDEKRDIEAKIVPVGRIYISCESVLSGLSPPKSLTLLKSVETKSFSLSLCHYKGNTYLGMHNGPINVIGEDFCMRRFAPLSDCQWPYGLTVYQDHIYSLISGIPNTIKVYDLNSKLIKQWNRNDSRYHNRLAIVTDKVVVPDHEGKQLTVYSLTGQIIKHISCPMLQGKGSAACAVDESSVIVTSYHSSVACRVDINSEQTLWKCDDIVSPQATAMYGKNLVCIASDRKISFLNKNTGQLISEILVPAVHNGGCFVDIDVHDTTLVASTYHEGSNKVLFFKLNN